MPNQIKTIVAETESKFKEKGSLFIGQAYPVDSVEQAEEILTLVRKKYYDATHHCYAYNLLGIDPKYSDDGEPSGTAGVRILNAINHFDVVNLLVISIRYYGGTKLGVGPLGKAYYQSAYEALSLAEIIKKLKFTKAKITFDYDLTSKIHHYLSLRNAKIIDNIFEEKPAIIFNILDEEFEVFTKDIIEATNNRIELNIVEKDLFMKID